MAQLRQRYSSDDVVSKLNSTGSTLVQGTIVMMDTSTTDVCKLPTASTVTCLGVVMNDAPTGTYADIQQNGQALVLAGAGGVTVGQEVMPTTAGAGVAWSGGAGTNAFLVGLANTAAASGSLFECELKMFMKQG